MVNFKNFSKLLAELFNVGKCASALSVSDNRCLHLIVVLVSERRNREDPELGSKVSDLTLPRRHKLQNTITEPKPPAVITIPGTLLREQYKGKSVIELASTL